jgi:hypothetical protein
LGKLGILKNKSSLGWSGFGSITRKEQGNIRQIQHSKKEKWKTLQNLTFETRPTSTTFPKTDSFPFKRLID